MTYECITHFRNHRAFYEHRLDGQRIVIGAINSILVPNGALTPWQLSELIKHDLIHKTDDPFELPPEPVRKAPVSPPSFCFVQCELMEMALLDHFFDGRPASGYTFRTFSHESMAHLIHWSGAFSSVSNARKNGWDKPVPPGFTQLVVTKRRIPIAILNRFDRDDDTEDK